MNQANDWLAQYLLGSDPPDPGRSQGISLADILEAFNMGELGPQSCDEAEVSNPGPHDETDAIVLEADPMTVVANGGSVVVVKITVGQDAAFAELGPVDVILTTSLGTFAGGATEGVVVMTNGAAQIPLHAGTKPGTAVIKATLNEATAQMSVEFTEMVSPTPS